MALSADMRVLFSIAALLVPGVASASAFYVADIGTRGLARGGAFVAAPDSLLAVHYNPAGLSLMKGLQVEADLSIVALDFTFQRHCPCTDPAKNPDSAQLDMALEQQFLNHPSKTNALHRIPYLAVGYGFPTMDLTVALAVWGPNSGKYEFGVLPPANSPAFEQAARGLPNRYTALTADTLEANYALGFGLKPLDWLRVGGAIIVYRNANDQNLHLWVNSATFASEPEQPGFDVPILLKFNRDAALNWQLGATVEPIAGLSIGASFRGKRSIRADGSIDVDLPQVLRDFNAMVTGRDITIEINTPPIARAGVQYKMPNVFTAELAAVYEHWSTYDRVVVYPKNIEFSVESGGTRMSQQLATIIQPRKWEDTLSIRAGGELTLFEPALGLRAGYFYEPTAIPAEQLDSSRVDLDKHGFAIGASTTWYGVTLEVAVMAILMKSVEVRNSQVQVTASLQPPLGSDRYVTAVSNGNYDASYIIGSASLSFALDPLLRD